MKTTITGIDSVSKQIIDALASGLRVSDVPLHYPVSLDQAKRLSRLKKMLLLAKENLAEDQYERFYALGLKSLPLSPLFKQRDWAGITELLAVTTENTTRDELQLLISGLEEKRQRITEFKENTELQLTGLEKSDRELQKREKELLQKGPAFLQELEEIQKKRSSIQQEIEGIKKNLSRTYMKVADIPEFISAEHLKLHRDIQFKALKWLFKRGYTAVGDYPLPNGKKADIFAYNASSELLIIDVKVSQSDIWTDKKWADALAFCHDYYFLTPAHLSNAAEEKAREGNCGQLIDAGESIRLVRPDSREGVKVEHQEELIFAAGQLLSRKWIYGY
ncbi:MmcB family DNA repair protein [Bacillus sp. S/N-304-OC-R1]|uniref:MmcB family DNA repair protein n=1 Tax=Bacillus sp. S/N-304-OC-R1 TaxID=2758034 RepID=UPI001C8DE1D9|nr:MmcB family DNA repair protein [Bacillus sp. S/N-304-OC-R1]MBY0123298.1 MmcB family DNA repair protein [Bacillus sp. S/N-304-OC-R1]